MATDSTSRSWSGGKHDSPEVRHRWQSDWTELQNSQFRAPPRRLRRWLLVLFALAWMLLAGFVYALIYAPYKTPLLAIAATNYEWPLPPNAWAAEDVQNLLLLDNRNLFVTDTSAAWVTKEQGLAEFDRQLGQLARSSASGDVAVIYLSMHSAVNDSGQPCLIPPGVSPLQAARWLPIQELLERIDRSLPKATKKLVILDTNRELANWRRGVVFDTFPDRLAELVEQQAFANLVVLSSVASGQRAWGSADLQASIFAKYVRLGLAGAADLRQVSAPEASGNGDGKVSLHELHRYVRQQVSSWVRANRADEQWPQLLPSQTPDFNVTWAINRRSISQLVESANSVTRREDAVPAEERAKLWQQLAELRSQAPLEYDPLGWRDLEHQLLWLEQLSTSGLGYHRRAEELQRNLRERFRRIQAKVPVITNSRSMLARANLLSDSPVTALASGAHSLALGEYLSVIDRAAQQTFFEALLRLATTGDEEQLEHELNQHPEREWLSTAAETQLLRLALRYQCNSLWPSNDVLPSVLETRRRAEELVTFGDLRAQRWMQPRFEALQHRLRDIEDTMFAGAGAARGDLAQQARTLVDDLTQELELPRERAARALAFRDEAWAELPYLAQWACRPLPVGTLAAQVAEHDQRVSQSLVPLIEMTWQLGEAIAATPTAAAEGVLPFAARAEEAAGPLTVWRDHFAQSWQQLLDPLQTEADTLREIEDVLQSPLLPWDKRLALTKKLALLATQLHQTARTTTIRPEPVVANNAAEPVDGSAPVSLEPSYLERVLSWEEHPLLAILQLDSARKSETTSVSVGGDAMSQVESWANRARRRLANVTQTETEPPTSTEPLAESTRVRAELARRERLTRTTAALGAPVTESDPIAELRSYDLQQMLLWNCRRVLDDFWGPIERERNVDARSYFDVAATNYLDAAQAVLPLRGAGEQQARELQSLLSQRRIAARSALRVTAEAEVQMEPTSPVSVAVTIAASKTPTREEAEARGNAGQAAVFVRAPQGSLSGERPLVRLPLNASPEIVQFHGNPPTGAGRAFDVVTLFRGHEYTTPLIVEQLGGLRIDFQPHSSRQAQVTLFGDRPKRSSIVFILDCSSSMAKTIQVEAIGDYALPRLDLAKSALATMLDELAARTDARVGVRFFGHRIGWTKSEPPQALEQSGYAGEIPDDLSPSADVELILPLGRFDSVEAGKVVERMKSVLPWGQSPLYLAITQAIADFDVDDGDTDQSIVVITDGVNYQFSPPTSSFGPSSRSTQRDVLNALTGKSIPVFILGFGVADDEAAQAEREFRAIASQSQGEYHNVENGRDLLDALRNRFSLGGYLVTTAKGDSLGPISDRQPLVKLNTPVVIDEVEDRANPYQVRFEALEKPFELRGGEALEMMVTEGGTDIIARPYDDGFPVISKLVRRGDARQFIVRAHRPTSRGGAVTFPVSIQAEYGHFTPRPAEVWMEVTPLVSQPQVEPRTYTFYDTNFEPNKPVPVLQWTAIDWPHEARQAAIRVWMKFDETQPTLAIPIAELLQGDTTFADFQPLPGIPGVRIKIDTRSVDRPDATRELRIVELHSPDSLGVQSIKTHLLLSNTMKPRRVVHQFDPPNGLAIHTYLWDRQFESRLATSGSARIAFYSREAVLDGTWRLADERPLIVDVFGAGEVLPLNAATGDR